MENKFKMKLPFMKNSSAAKASGAAHKLRFGKDPYFDWTVILALFIVTTILCISFAFALWRTVTEGPSVSNVPSSATSTISVPSLDTVDLSSVTSIQSEKSANASQYEQGYPGPKDPSQ